MAGCRQKRNSSACRSEFLKATRLHCSYCTARTSPNSSSANFVLARFAPSRSFSTSPWRDLLIQTVRATVDNPENFDASDERVAAALDEQQAALEVITTRKLTCLVGRAGTGKTTVLGALSRAVSQEGNVLFLAPTGESAGTAGKQGCAWTRT